METSLKVNRWQAALRIIRKKRMIFLLQKKMKMIKNKNTITINKMSNSMDRLEDMTTSFLINKTIRKGISKALKLIWIRAIDDMIIMRADKTRPMIR